MKGDFLHKIDIDKLSKETGLSLDEIASLADIKEARNLGKWNQDKSGGSRPNFNAIVRLLEKGATVETLFGVDYKPNKLVQNSAPSIPPELANDPAFQKGLQQSIDAKVSAAVKAEIASLKSKGLL